MSEFLVCEYIYYFREFSFYLFMFSGALLVFSSAEYARRKGVDFNSFFGMMDIYRRIFQFESKRFSLVFLFVMGGNMILWLASIALYYWGGSRGCVF